MYIKRYLKTIKEGEKVVDLGSGHDPYERADVCVDMYFDDNTEREGENIIMPKTGKMVNWDLNKYPLPFKDKEFDFVICGHIVEHLDRPDLFLDEIQRIGKRGYIETPNKLYELIYGWPFHKSYVYVLDNKLILEQIDKEKPFAKVGRKLYGSNKIFTETHDQNIEKLLTSFYWEDKIDYQVIPPAKNISWKYISNAELDNNPVIVKNKWPFLLRRVLKLIKR